MNRYSKSINDVRERLGVSKQAVADKLGVLWATADSKLSGKTEFDISEAVTIADWWGMSLDELVGRSNV